uniref:SWIM-type domain-containing protein n=2 Tax=Tetranychus urticae TaxID=32264 RepID=T1KLY2_TETUR
MSELEQSLSEFSDIPETPDSTAPPHKRFNFDRFVPNPVATTLIERVPTSSEGSDEEVSDRLEPHIANSSPYPDSDPDSDIDSDSNSSSDSDSGIFYLSSNDDEASDPDYVPVSVNTRSNAITRLRASRSSHSCCVFNCSNPDRLSVIPDKHRYQVLDKLNIYIPKGARCCHSHRSFRLEEWQTLEPFRDIHSEEFYEIFDFYRNSGDRNTSNFLPPPLPENDSDYRFWTGISVANFLDLLSYIMTDTSNRELLASKLLSWNGEIRSALLTKFVPFHLGLRDSFSRSDAQQHITPIARALFSESNDSNELISIWDCTYMNQQKSGNMEYQKRSFSEQKKNNLFKPMICVFPDGYIYDIFNPHAAVDNYATILEYIARNDEGFTVQGYLESNDFDVYMPKSNQEKYRGFKQLPWLEANRSREVTKCRWAIESVNAQFKRYKYLASNLPNKSVGKIVEIIRICGALINRYQSRLVSDVRNSEQIIDRLLSRRYKFFEPYNPCSDTIFPRIISDDVNLYACGNYALKFLRAYKDHTSKLRQAGQSMLDPFRFVYCANLDHFDLDTYNIVGNDLVLFRCEIRGRMSTGKTHKVFILVDREIRSLDSLIEHHCDCKSGQRTTSCCLHVAAAIWLFGGGMQDLHRGPAAHLDTFASCVPAGLRPTASLAKPQLQNNVLKNIVLSSAKIPDLRVGLTG